MYRSAPQTVRDDVHMSGRSGEVGHLTKFFVIDNRSHPLGADRHRHNPRSWLSLRPVYSARRPYRHQVHTVGAHSPGGGPRHLGIASSGGRLSILTGIEGASRPPPAADFSARSHPQESGGRERAIFAHKRPVVPQKWKSGGRRNNRHLGFAPRILQLAGCSARLDI